MIEPMRAGPSADARTRERPWLPVVAFVFGILALVALTVTPALMLRRVDDVTEEARTVFVPAYAALGDFALAMQERVAAGRTRFVADDPAAAARHEAARIAETRALRELERQPASFGPAYEQHFEALRRHIARRDSLQAELLRTAENLQLYAAALPRFDQLRDSMLVHILAMEDELVSVANARLAQEARWASMQRSLSVALGAVAVLAAIVIGWFALTQQRLRRQVQRALAETDRLRAEADRRRVELERVTESRARLTRGFTHDVKNPLGAANGYLQLLADGVLGPLSEQQGRSVQRASASIGAALHLVEDLLDLARADSGNLEIAPAPTDICALVHDVAQEYRAQAEGKGLRLELSLPERAPIAVTDGKRVRQVLGNLISNAVKYTREGAVTVRLDRSGENGAHSDGKLAIAVADTGPGIPPEKQDLLFQEFVRLEPETGQGAGIGLTISHRIAQALGGEITVDSEVGRGSVFTLHLPAHPAGDTPRTPPHNE